jgi:hypothetical protein
MTRPSSFRESELFRAFLTEIKNDVGGADEIQHYN